MLFFGLFFEKVKVYAKLSTEYIYICSGSVKNAYEMIPEQLLVCMRWTSEELFKDNLKIMHARSSS